MCHEPGRKLQAIPTSMTLVPELARLRTSVEHHKILISAMCDDGGFYNKRAVSYMSTPGCCAPGPPRSSAPHMAQACL